jgi:hypothetical protein
MLDSQNIWRPPINVAMTGGEDRDMQRGKRLERLRLFHGYDTQNAFAAWLGVSPTRWNNYERGMPLTRAIEDLLVKRTPGLSVDWLRNANRNGLSVELDRRLHQPQPARRAS